MSTEKRHTQLKDKASIRAIIKEMPLEDKAKLTVGATFWTSCGIEKFGIPALRVTDGPHGVRNTESEDNLGAGRSGISTGFPTGVCMASTWDPALIERVGGALGREAAAKKNDILLGPCVNIHRTPLGGRNFESLGEDPYLAGKIAAAYINGVQSRGVGTSIKHFAVNNQEYQRTSISVEISERALREIYLEAFRTAVRDARPWTVMSAYNKINGSYCSENRYLLKDILRGEWGFDGLVMSDWGAVHDHPEAVRAGNDLKMPGGDGSEALVEAVKNGKLDESELDHCVENLLALILKSKVFTGNNGEAFESFAKEHAALSLEAAVSGIVLLKNEENMLPISKQMKIAVMGPNAFDAVYQGFGSSRVTTPYAVSPYDGLREEFGEHNVVHFPYQKDEGDSGAILEAAGEADCALLFMGPVMGSETEGDDRRSMRLAPDQEEYILSVCEAFHRQGKKAAVVLNNGAPLEMGGWLNAADALLEAWLPGQECGRAIAAILSGRVNPSGKLCMTLPKTLKQHPSYINYPGHAGKVYYGEGLYVGYRYYDTFDAEAEYEFGFGLSYTEFTYSNLKIERSTFNIDTDTQYKLRFDLKNTGSRAGAEAAQVYIHDVKSTLQKPYKALKAFAKVALRPGEQRTVELELNRDSLAHYDAEKKGWFVETGVFEILIGSSSKDIRLRGELEAVGDNPYCYGMYTDIGALLDYGPTREVLYKYFTKEHMERDDIVYSRTNTLAQYICQYGRWFSYSEEKIEEVKRKMTEELKPIPVRNS